MTVALILAAGSGERLGAGRPKALVELAGRPLLQWSLDALREASIERIVVALPPGVPVPAGTLAAEGGATRSQSVRNALAVAPSGELVLVHDAARPLLTARLARETVQRLQADADADAAIAAARVTDTIKRATADVVLETLVRSELWAVQTPQVFRRAALERALDVPSEVLAQATDDAWLIERNGGKVLLVESSAENLKVTTQLDLSLAAALLARRPSAGHPSAGRAAAGRGPVGRAPGADDDA